MNLIDKNIMHLPVGHNPRADILVEFDWIDKVGDKRPFKVNLDNVVWGNSRIKQVLLEEIEEKVAFAATAHANYNFDEVIVLGCY